VEAPVTIYLPANVPAAKAAKLEAAPFFSRLRCPAFSRSRHVEDKNVFSG
jgi:hypothetical protein